MGLPGATFSVADLGAAGVKRISVGSALARLAYGAVARAAAEMRDQGTFSFAEGTMGFKDLEALVTERA
jgi:2-methylisocitrate lyase-like PEP mutase family enzyme